MRAIGYRTPTSLRVSLFSLALAAAVMTDAGMSRTRRPEPVPRPAVQRTNSSSDGSGTVVKPKRGIPPPWHENWIPELRRRPGTHTRSTTA
jgi:hypothetical protein